MRHILQLIRLPNLIIIALTLYAFRYFVLRPYYGMSGTEFQLTGITFGLLTATIMLIAAAGYLANDFFDIEIDRVNRPEKALISDGFGVRSLLASSVLFSILSAICFVWLSFSLSSILPACVFGLALFTVWWYAKALKRSLVLGNLAVSLMSALTLGTAWFFEWLKLWQSDNHLYEIRQITQIAAGIILFAFLLSLIREIIKDWEDIEGDKLHGCRSIPVVFGTAKTRSLVYSLVLLLTGFLAAGQFWLWTMNFPLVVAWLFVAVELPLLRFLFILRNASSSNKLHILSRLLKYIMIGGISSMVVLWLNFLI